MSTAVAIFGMIGFVTCLALYLIDLTLEASTSLLNDAGQPSPRLQPAPKPDPDPATFDLDEFDENVSAITNKWCPSLNDSESTPWNPE